MTDYTELKRAAEAVKKTFADLCEHGGDQLADDWCAAEIAYDDAANPDVVLALIAENERLAANVKLNLCDYPAIHSGDVDLLISLVSGTSQIALAELHQCTPPNISRKIRRVKGRLGWKEGMGPLEIRARAEQLRALASQGAVVTADLMTERNQLKADNETWRLSIEAERRVHKATVQGLQDELDRLKGPAFEEELAALRKDAERWRFFSLLANDLQAFPHAWGKMTPEKMDAMCDQAMADAAMGQGEQP